MLCSSSAVFEATNNIHAYLWEGQGEVRQVWKCDNMQLALKICRNVMWLAMGHQHHMNIHMGFTPVSQLIGAESCIFICLRQLIRLL